MIKKKEEKGKEIDPSLPRTLHHHFSKDLERSGNALN